MAEFPITKEYIGKLVILNELGQWESFRTEERIVRCKNCKSFINSEEEFNEFMQGKRDSACMSEDPNAFCSWGEPKEVK